MNLLDVTESVYNFFFFLHWVLSIVQHVGDLGITQLVEKKTGLQIHHLIKRLNWKILGGDGLLTEVERIDGALWIKDPTNCKSEI